MKARSMHLTAGRLVLKAFEDADREALLRMTRDERVRATYMIPDFAGPAQEEAFFRRLRTLSLSPERIVYGIFLDGALIGMINDCGIRGTAVELGYFLSPEHWGRGYATEALRAVTEELFRIGCESITAGYFEGNEASRRVMEKCGMRPLGTEAFIDDRGVRRRCLYCGIRRADRIGGRAGEDG